MLTNQVLREESIRATVQRVVGEQCALAASSGLIHAAPDEASRCCLAPMEPEEMERVLADTVLEDFKHRLSRTGIEYQTPARP